MSTTFILYSTKLRLAGGHMAIGFPEVHLMERWFSTNNIVNYAYSTDFDEFETVQDKLCRVNFSYRVRLDDDDDALAFNLKWGPFKTVAAL